MEEWDTLLLFVSSFDFHMILCLLLSVVKPIMVRNYETDLLTIDDLLRSLHKFGLGEIDMLPTILAASCNNMFVDTH